VNHLQYDNTNVDIFYTLTVKARVQDHNELSAFSRN